jgi:hypothetical protein
VCANRGLVCTLENFKWCAESYFVDAANVSGRCLALILGGTSVRYYCSDQCLIEGFSLMLVLKRPLFNRE